MQSQLANLPDALPSEPEGIETIRIDRQTGEPATGGGTMLELFMEDNMPGDVENASDDNEGERADGGSSLSDARNRRDRAKEVEQLF